MRPKRNTLFSNDLEVSHRELSVPLRRKDSPAIDLVLEFNGRVKTKALTGVAPTRRPSAALIWHGKRIRGLDYTIIHEVLQDGVVVGSIKGWHEHYWTDSDEDNSIREPNPPVKNFDLQAIIEWCSVNWNIEGIQLQSELFHE